MNNPKDSIWDDTEVMAQVEDLDFYEVDPFDVTHDLSYYGLELVLPVTDTRTLYLPCSWLGYIDYQERSNTDSDTIWDIGRTLSTYKVKISDFVEITEDQPFLYDYNNSGYPVPCYEYTFKTNQESDQPSLSTPLGQRIAQLNDILTNQLDPLVNDIISEFSGSILSDELTHLLGRLSVLLKEPSPNKFPSKTCYLRLFDPISNQ